MPAATSLNCCNAFIRGWLSRYGSCQTLTTDNGNTFQANLWKDLARVLGIEVNYVPRYHQATNGAIERQHRTLKESLKASLVQMGDIHRERWMEQLPFTLLGRRAAFQPDLQSSAADMTLGGDVVLPGLAFKEVDGPDQPQELLKNLQTKASRDSLPMS